MCACNMTWNDKKLQKEFFCVYVIGTAFFDKCFSFHVITRRHYFL